MCGLAAEPLAFGGFAWRCVLITEVIGLRLTMGAFGVPGASLIL